MVPSQKENITSCNHGYTHKLISIGYIPSFKCLLHCITYLIKNNSIMIAHSLITYLQIGCDPSDSPYQLTKRSHTGLGSMI